MPMGEGKFYGQCRYRLCCIHASLHFLARDLRTAELFIHPKISTHHLFAVPQRLKRKIFPPRGDFFDKTRSGKKNTNHILYKILFIPANLAWEVR